MKKATKAPTMSSIQRGGTPGRDPVHSQIGHNRPDFSERPVAIEMVATANLKPSKHRARKHDPKQISMLAQSMVAFGVNKAVVIDTDNNIVAGHAIVEAAKKLKLKQVACIRANHLSEDELRAYALADNKLAERSAWDEKALKSELGHLVTIDLPFEIEATGFEMAEIEVILDGKSIDDDPLDALPEVSKGAPTTRIGDLFLLGKHRLLCASSLDAASFDLLMDGKKADSIHSDSPYNVPVNGHVSSTGKHAEFGSASGEMSVEEFVAFLTAVLANMVGVAKDGAILQLWMDWRHVFEMEMAARANHLTKLNLCIWNKMLGAMGSLYRSQHELCFIYKHGKAPHTNMVELGKHGRYRTNVWDHKGLSSFGRGRDQALADHPTQKPVAITADAIRDVTRRNDIVLDPFLGSGTTLIACERVARACYGIELNPTYCDTIVRRYEKLTGGDAIHAQSGRTLAELEQKRRAEREALTASPLAPPINAVASVRHRVRPTSVGGTNG